MTGRVKKMRLDMALVQRGLAPSRTQAQAAILAGKVYCGTSMLDKAGMEIAEDADLTLRGSPHPWVSRGGLKLAHGLNHFAIDPTGMTGLDIGASTGGFTDVLLAHGARRVYAVDVGRGQLSWRLRTNDNVRVLERTNARDLTRDHINEPVDILVCDASFIGLRTILPAPMALTRPGAWMITLIKPQFEVGPQQVGKGGVVRNPDLHKKVCADIGHWLESQNWSVVGVTPSPVRGPAGNKEFLVGARKPS